MYETQKDRAEAFLTMAAKTVHHERNWMIQILNQIDSAAQAENAFNCRRAELEESTSVYLNNASKEGL